MSFSIMKKSHNDTEVPFPEIPHRAGAQQATAAGERALWIVFAIFAVSTAIFALTTIRVHAKNRLFGLITTFITLFASIAYFSMATGGGNVLVDAPGKHHAVRELFYARYVDWSVTTPLLVLDLALLAGLSPLDTVLAVIADVGMIVTGLFAGLDNGVKTRWYYYTVSCLFFIWVLYYLVIAGVSSAKLRGNRVSGAYYGLAGLTAILWTAYPIVWAFAEGTNYISVDTEIYLYAVLDVLAKSGFGFGLLFALSRKRTSRCQASGRSPSVVQAATAPSTSRTTSKRRLTSVFNVTSRSLDSTLRRFATLSRNDLQSQPVY